MNNVHEVCIKTRKVPCTSFMSGPWSSLQGYKQNTPIYQHALLRNKQVLSIQYIWVPELGFGTTLMMEPLSLPSRSF